MVLARAILGVSLAYATNQLTDDEDFGRGEASGDYDLDREYDEIPEASGDFQPITNQVICPFLTSQSTIISPSISLKFITSKVLNNPNVKSAEMDEPKNILDAVEDDLAAAEQEPKLFLGMFQKFNNP